MCRAEVLQTIWGADLKNYTKRKLHAVNLFTENFKQSVIHNIVSLHHTIDANIYHNEIAIQVLKEESGISVHATIHINRNILILYIM